MLPAFLQIDSTPNVLVNFGITTMFFVMGALIIAKVFIDTGLGYRISLYITPLLGAKSKMVLLSLMPVSYTHLDVYKRQILLL